MGLVEQLNRVQLIEKIDTHLRNTARQLIKFNTLHETLDYLIESFWKQFKCDYVSILLKEGDFLFNKINKGESAEFAGKFPIKINSVTKQFLERSICAYDIQEETERCELLKSIESERFSVWFTVPIKESNSESYGVCVIGSRRNVKLVPGGRKLLIEFGNDIAVALELALHKEKDSRKIKGIEWITDNLYLNDSTEDLIQGIVEQAGKGTHAESACIYLYDELNQCLVYQQPSFGSFDFPLKLDMSNIVHLSDIFPMLEKEGSKELSVPLVVNLKTIGVLHVVREQGSCFSLEDLNFLRLLSSHVSVLIENARIYHTEKKDKNRLEKMMVHNQELVKQTLVGEGFTELTETLSRLVSCTVVFLDRFLTPISYHLVEKEDGILNSILEALDRAKHRGITNQVEEWIEFNSEDSLGIWKVVSGKEGLGFLCLKMNKKKLDMALRLTINQALIVYAIQFIKQKQVLEVTEQVKGNFLDHLFSEKIMDKRKILEYCNIFNLNPYERHKIGVFSIDPGGWDGNNNNLLDFEAKKARVTDLLREQLAQWEQSIVLARREGNYVIFVPEKLEKERNEYWHKIYHRIKKIIALEFPGNDVYLGISYTASKIEDYYICYKQALQTLHIVSERFPKKGFMSFDRLGSYTVLYNIEDSFVVRGFFEKYLKPLLDYGDKGKDLFDTLRIYLNWNGNLKDTAEALFIHRNSLKYRLEKITDLLDIEITDAEERFNLMLAYKLYDLYDL